MGLSVLFDAVPDGRARNARHGLADLLLIAFAGVLCGAQSCVDMAEFGRAKRHVLGEFLDLGHGSPSHDTFSRVFRLLNPEAFEQAFRRFTEAFAAALAPTEGPRVVAIDGKLLKGAVDAARKKTPLMLVTAWAAEQRLVLGQREAKGAAEADAAREIIGLLDLVGTVVTADALHASRETAAAILARGGDYALTIKGNRGPLHRAAAARLAEADPDAAATVVETAHGRREERRAWVVPVPGWAEAYRFPGLQAMVRIDSRRGTAADPGRINTRYIALSRPFAPEEALRIVRAHWSIENRQHWMLDVVFAEDRTATRNDNTAKNLALLRRLALNLLRHDPDKGSLRVKTKQAGWNDEYLKTLLVQMR